MNVDWIIVGGGIHGTHIALKLLLEGGVPRGQLRIVDPAPRLLARWRDCTAVTGMEYLRSASVQNLSVETGALRHFAKRHTGPSDVPFAPPYNRPSLALFNAHCDRLIEQTRLDELHLQDRVSESELSASGVRLRTEGGLELDASRVVLALGSSDEPHWPGWAPRGDARVQHIFGPEGGAMSSQGCGTIAVIGGGVSAAQTAVRLASEGHLVQLVSRHEMRVEQFDVAPGWLGPKYMAGFRRTRDLERRREMIHRARKRGTMPPDVKRALQHAMTKGRVEWIQAEVQSADATAGRLRLHLGGGRELAPDHVLLATGFTTKRPGGRMIDRLIESASLPCARCGYPIVDASLRWHERIHVSGPLAELELGPAARNIAGARRAGERILEAQQARLAPARG